MSEPIPFVEDMGLHIQREGYHIFFGDRQSDFNHLQQRYRNYQFFRLVQVHGHRIVAASSTPERADGHWTNKTLSALCIQTADCLPVFIAHREVIYALHAGWRGLESQIVVKALSQMQKKSSLKTVEVFVGPHIGPRSFEVGRDVGDRLALAHSLLAASKSLPPIVIPHSDHHKMYIDLSLILRAQLLEAGLKSEQIHFSGHDTFSSSRFHSFRRDGAKAGRQISFIVRTELLGC